MEDETARAKLFRTDRQRRTDEIVAYYCLHVPTALIAVDPATDTVGVANGGLGYQLMSILLGRYPNMDIRVIGSGTLKESRPAFDDLLPKILKRKATALRKAAEKNVVETATDAPEAASTDKMEEGEDAVPESAKGPAKDQNARYDAHRIAFALAESAVAKAFRPCTAQDREWAETRIAYLDLETARKARVAAEQQFRQIHRTELRSLIRDRRVTSVTLWSDDGPQAIEYLLKAYDAALATCEYGPKQRETKLTVLRQAYVRIEGARAVEKCMEEALEQALDTLPEYTEFLPFIKAMEDKGKFIGPRIFGRWIAGFGSPMATRLRDPMREADAQRIAFSKTALTTAIASFTDRNGLPHQPAPGRGATGAWLRACAERVTTDAQLEQLNACRVAYKAFGNARKCAGNRPLNRVIAFMGLHVRSGGKYAGTSKNLEFPRRRKGGRANWNEELMRQGAYQWGTLIIKGGSYWKSAVYEPYKARLVARGVSKGHAHKRAFWRMLTTAVRWLVNEWFAWERRRMADGTTQTSGTRTTA